MASSDKDIPLRRRLLRLFSGVLPLLLIPLIFSCSGPPAEWEESFGISPRGWSYGERIEGSWLPEEDLPQSYLLIELTHRSDYRYQNLYLTGSADQDGIPLFSDTFSVQLATSNSGRWLGEKKDRETYILSDTVSILPAMAAGRPVKFSFGQYGRDSLLRGIDEVSFRIIR